MFELNLSELLNDGIAWWLLLLRLKLDGWLASKYSDEDEAKYADGFFMQLSNQSSKVRCMLYICWVECIGVLVLCLPLLLF